MASAGSAKWNITPSPRVLTTRPPNERDASAVRLARFWARREAASSPDCSVSRVYPERSRNAMAGGTTLRLGVNPLSSMMFSIRGTSSW